MDILQIIETFGVPIAVAIAFGYFIWKQNKYIQDDLTKDIKDQFQRLEGIVIQLINQQKKMQLEQKNYGLGSMGQELKLFHRELIMKSSNVTSLP